MQISKELKVGNTISIPAESNLLIKIIITSILSFIILITLIYFDLDLSFIYI